MNETIQDLEALDRLLTASIERAGPFLRSSFEMPDKSLSARQLCRYLNGVQTVALATVTAKGEPRVTPIDGFLYQGRFHIPTTMEAMRVRHVRRQPAVSLTLFDGVDFAVIVHGDAVVLGEDHSEFGTLEAIYRDLTGQSVRDWGTGAFLRIDAKSFFTFARYPDQYPS